MILQRFLIQTSLFIKHEFFQNIQQCRPKFFAIKQTIILGLIRLCATGRNFAAFFTHFYQLQLVFDLIVMFKVGIFIFLIGFILASEDEYRLLQDLRNEYDPVERPVTDHKQAIDVTLRIYLQQILEIVSF